MILEGTVNKILTQKDDDWGRYRIKPSNGGKMLLAVGVIPDVTIGMAVKLDGYEEDNQYGHQYKVTKVLDEYSDSLSGVRRFLVDGYLRGIGPTKGEAIIKKYGETAADLFDTELGRAALLKVKGISEKVLSTALESYQESKKYKGIVIFLNGVGSKGQVEKLYDKYGDKAVKTLKENPYRLQLDLDGFGFQRADRIALASGIKRDSVFRLMAAVKCALEDAEMAGGHCYLDIDELREKVGNLLLPAPKVKDVPDWIISNAIAKWDVKRDAFIDKYSLPPDKIQAFDDTASSRTFIMRGLPEAMDRAVKEGYIVNDDGRIYVKTMYDTERETATMVVEMLKKGPVRRIDEGIINKAIKDVEKRKTEELRKNGSDVVFTATEEQVNAVRSALSSRIAIISGGPGRGKTAISEIVAHAFLSAGTQYDRSDIIMLAPTGRAAQRITESTGYTAMTVHRAVFSMKMGQPKPKGKLILCDESSMVDIFLAKSLLLYAEDCNLILVGDADQIASVGPGKVLNDLIECGKVPAAILKQGHRNSGTIAENAALINEGRPRKEYREDEHFRYFPVTAENVKDTLIRDYMMKVNEYGIRDVLLCVAMRARGNACVDKLNAALQEAYTKGMPEAKITSSRVFRVGDRVMQTRNDYNFTKMKNGKQIKGVFNGEKGSIVKIDYIEAEDTYHIIVQYDDDSLGGYTSGTAQNLTLAYATTVHKCQGSEAPCVLMAYTYADYMLLNRSLFYTGETRAKKEFRYYGEEKERFGKMMSAFDIAVKREDSAERNTYLAERVQNIISGREAPYRKPVQDVLPFFS